jgi:ribulose-5-phosphate 4-epimerase/fuculose-1-phosphate aldolase
MLDGRPHVARPDATEMTMPTPHVRFDPATAELLLKYARMVVARGYVHNSLGNLAIRVAHPDFEHGVVYTKHAEVSLEEMTLDNVVITDVPTPHLLHGAVPTSVGHNLNREILRLRPDVHAVIHAHHDETIALFASALVKELRPLSLEFPYVMAKPPYVVPSHLDVENDVGPIAAFIQGTNAILMENHGVTTLGRTISEAYHRLNTLASEVRRVILAEQLAALSGEGVHYLAPDAVEWMYRHAESVIYPSRDATRRPDGGERRA